MTQPSILVACGSEWLAPARLPRVLHRAGAHVAAFCPRRSARTGK